MSFENKLRIELRDNNGVLLSYINNILNSASWSWDRIGGCGECKLKLQTGFDSVVAGSFAEDSEVRIYIPNVAGTAELWYSGYVDKVTPTVGATEFIDLYCLGYVNQLKRVVISDKTYTGQELSVIAKDVAEVYSTGITSITSASASYDDTGFSADSIYFNESAFEVFTKLADIAGKMEWGVDENKAFFFKKRDENINHFFNYKQDFVSFQPIRDFNEIITEMYLEGSDGYKQTFSVTNKITTRQVAVQNSSISTQSVGYQYARSILKEKGQVKISYQGRQIGRTTRIESTVPIGNALLSEKVFVRLLYDVATQLYDSGLKYDGGNIKLQIEKIKYDLRDSGINATIAFGAVPTSLSDEFAKLEYQINQASNI